MTFPLSVLDLSPIDAGLSSSQALQYTTELARTAEELGYTRYWVAEHHNTSSLASASPEILIAHLAQATSKIRVGSGGVMLPNHASLKVAENFRLLEALHPGRIDLGIGRAPGTDPKTALALRRSRSANADDFPEQLADLLSFTGMGFPEEHPFRGIEATPTDVALPPIWLLGSSDFSAQVAGSLGLGFSFAHHINPDAALLASRLYHEDFQPSRFLKKPSFILATAVIVADSQEQAEALASTTTLSFVRMLRGQGGPIPSLEEALAYSYTPMEQQLANQIRSRRIIGTPATVQPILERLIEETQADELMVTVLTYGHEHRKRSLELIAGMF